MTADSDVFISYAADTKPLAEQLTAALQKQGMHAWADFKDLRPGQRWQDELERALESAGWFVILVSPQSYATPWQESEWRAALTKVWSDPHKTIIPVVVGGGDAPPFLRNWVSLRIDPTAPPADWTREVLEALRSRRNESAHARSPQDRWEREKRLDEISRAARELGKREAGSSAESPKSIK